MAVDSKRKKRAARAGGFRSSTERRLIYGLNVAVMIAVAVLLLVLVNYLGQRHHLRKDLARLGAFVLSDRTKNVLDALPGEVRISSIYTSNDPQKDFRLYEPNVRDLLDEYRYQCPKVGVEVITSDERKIELIARVRSKYGSQAGPYQELLARSDDLARRLNEMLGADVQRVSALLEVQPPAWLAKFPALAGHLNTVARGQQKLQQTQDKVSKLTATGGALPRYDEAKNELATTYRQLKNDLQQGQDFLEKAREFVEAIQTGQLEFLSATPQRASQLRSLTDQLAQAVGKPADQLPDDPKAAVQAFARQASEIATWLEEEAARLRSFSSQHPLVADHSTWAVYIQIFGTIAQAGNVVDKVQALGEDMAGFRTQLRGILQRDTTAEQLKDVVAQLRQITRQQIEPRVQEISEALDRLVADLGQIDDDTLGLLSSGEGGLGYQDLIDELDELVTQLDELKDLKLEDIADKLREDNVVVVETEGKARVLSFDDVWPMSISPWTAFAGPQEDKPRRVFNGDQAISSALIALTHDQPFASVIIAYFRPQPTPGPMGQQIPPPSSSLPERRFSTLRGQLERANLVIKEWNLAEGLQPPEPDEGTVPVYLFLPPPPARPPMGMQQTPERSFGEPEREAVRQVLAENGRAIFLASFELPRPMSPFMPPAPAAYLYGSMLSEEWGIEVGHRQRVIKARPDPGRAGLYRITLGDWSFLRLNEFTDHPVGKPLRAARCLTNDVCPVLPADQPPEGIRIEPILTVPARDDWWAENDVVRLVSRVLQGEAYVTKDLDDRLAPFPVIVAAENDRGSKIIVAGIGAGLLDGYLDERVAVLEGDAIRFDPPPSSNADILVNAVLWLADKPELIGAGPALVPPIQPIEPHVRSTLWVVVMGWSLLALVVGGVMMAIRRR